MEDTTTGTINENLANSGVSSFVIRRRVTSLLFVLACITVQPAFSFNYDDISLISELEKQLYGAEHPNLPLSQRLEEVERTIIGTVQTGSESCRIKSVCRKAGLQSPFLEDPPPPEIPKSFSWQTSSRSRVTGLRAKYLKIADSSRGSTQLEALSGAAAGMPTSLESFGRVRESSRHGARQTTFARGMYAGSEAGSGEPTRSIGSREVQCDERVNWNERRLLSALPGETIDSSARQLTNGQESVELPQVRPGDKAGEKAADKPAKKSTAAKIEPVDEPAAQPATPPATQPANSLAPEAGKLVAEAPSAELGNKVLGRSEERSGRSEHDQGRREGLQSGEQKAATQTLNGDTATKAPFPTNNSLLGLLPFFIAGLSGAGLLVMLLANRGILGQAIRNRGGANSSPSTPTQSVVSGPEDEPQNAAVVAARSNVNTGADDTATEFPIDEQAQTQQVAGEHTRKQHPESEQSQKQPPDGSQHPDVRQTESQQTESQPDIASQYAGEMTPSQRIEALLDNLAETCSETPGPADTASIENDNVGKDSANSGEIIPSPLTAAHSQDGADARKRFKAIAECTNALALDPKDTAAFKMRARALMAVDDLDGALRDYAQALHIDPSDCEAYNQRALLRLAMGDEEGAMEDLSQCLSLNTHFIAAYRTRGVVLQALGEHDAAVHNYSSLLALYPHADDAHTGRARSRLETGDLEGAIADATAVLSRQARIQQAYKVRGIAHMRNGDLKEALHDFSESLRLDPDDEECRELYARVHSELHVESPS